jgi:hypothetical protein
MASFDNIKYKVVVRYDNGQPDHIVNFKTRKNVQAFWDEMLSQSHHPKENGGHVKTIHVYRRGWKYWSWIQSLGCFSEMYPYNPRLTLFSAEIYDNAITELRD